MLGQLVPRRVHRHLEVLGQRLQRLLVVGRGGAGLRPRIDGAFGEGEVGVGHDEVGLELQLGAEAVAGRAGAGGRVEREQPRLDLVDGEAGDGAGEARREGDALVRLVLRLVGALGVGVGQRLVGQLGDDHLILRQPERGLEAVGQALGDVGAHDEAVHDHVDVVLELLVELGRLVDLVERAVDLDALEALLLQLGQLLLELALAAAGDGRQQVDARALGDGEHAVDHLRHGLALDRQPGGRRIGHADAREQQAQVVVDLRHRADGGARVLRGRLLLDGDGRRQAVDVVDVRLLHHLQELARVGRQAFDVAALALGVDGVEGERGLARAGQAREHDEGVARDLQVDVLQVVLARAADVDRLHQRRRRGRLRGFGHGVCLTDAETGGKCTGAG